MSLIRILSRAVRHQHLNLFKTLYFNFKVFPFRQARKLPVFLYGKVCLDYIYRGCLSLKQVRTRVVRFGGGFYSDIFGNTVRHQTVIHIKGKVYCDSYFTALQGSIISICEGAVLNVGSQVYLNERVTVNAKERIDLHDKCRIGWNCQILDTSYHYIVDNGKVSYRTRPVIIGHNTWVANNVQILKGSQLPAYSIVGTGSLVNKDLSQYGEHCLFAGTPAKFIKSGVERLILNEEQLDKLFHSPDEVLLWDEIKDELEKPKYNKK